MLLNKQGKFHDNIPPLGRRDSLPRWKGLLTRGNSSIDIFSTGQGNVISDQGAVFGVV
jgi:hypothetical protein